MAYVTKEVVAKCRAGAAAIRKQYGIKMTFSVNNGSTLMCTIQSGRIDFFGSLSEKAASYSDGKYCQVNTYHIDSSFTGEAAECLKAINDLMHVDHWDKSDIMTDYFNCAYYVNIHVGRWDKGYELVK
jgi:hypothetical protein